MSQIDFNLDLDNYNLSVESRFAIAKFNSQADSIKDLADAIELAKSMHTLLVVTKHVSNQIIKGDLGGPLS